MRGAGKGREAEESQGSQPDHRVRLTAAGDRVTPIEGLQGQADPEAREDEPRGVAKHEVGCAGYKVSLVVACSPWMAGHRYLRTW